MSLGIVSYCQRTGLGIMAQELRKHCGITSQLAIAHDGFSPPFDFEMAANCHLNGAPAGGNPFDFTQYAWEVQRADLEAWASTQGVKTAVFVETPFGKNTFRWCKELGIKTALIVMGEWFDYRSPSYRDVDLYICPTFRSYQEVPFDNRTYLPWAVDTEAIPFRERAGKAVTFVHNAGNLGLNYRKGTPEVVRGFCIAGLKNKDIRLLVRVQRPLSDDLTLDIELFNHRNGNRISVEIGSKPTVAELYAGGDVMLYPSRYDGHSLVGLEAMCAGMPLITTDAAPMNEYVKPDDPLLVRVGRRYPAGTINPAYEATVVDAEDLAAKILFCAENDMGEISRRNRQIVEKDYSWTALGDRWRQVLSNIESR